jgi:asparagine synthase (glutamine-hydrolysing)
VCGIVGIFGLKTESALQPLLGRMVTAIAHRGPDANGIHVEGDVGLGHARLSIIDIAGGQQPMANDDGSIWITFNGEIFNYLELRRDLIERGHRFVTDSDTEVIIRAYEDMGPDCVSAFNGDFAFALWDKRKGRMMLARDRMGVRPLYYAQHGGALLFASEVKALLTAPQIGAELDPIALDQIFTFWFPLAPRTIFKNICELPPAHLLIADANGVRTRPYWRLDYPDAGDDEAEDRRNAGEISEELRELFLDAVRIRLRSDVPVGAYLSGGLDSSMVVAAMKRMVPKRLRTFSVTFESAEFDESAFQQEMVQNLETAHSSIRCTTADIAQHFPHAIRHAERPILRTAPTPLLMLSKLTRANGFKVVLTGEGADEVFAGYDIFKEAKLRRFCAQQPNSRRRPLLLRRLYPYLSGLQRQSQSYLESFFATGAGDLADPLFSHLPRIRTTSGAKAFYSADLRAALKGYDAVAELRDSLPAEFGRWHPLSQAQYLECAYLLPGYILSSQGDRMAMANAVEGRFPFLDHRLVEFASRIPPKLKIRGLREKHMLREAARDLLPASIGDRPKQPYRAPDSQSFVGPNVPSYVASALSPTAIESAGLFDARSVEKLHEKCRVRGVSGFRDNAAFIGVLSTQLWHRAFVQDARAHAEQELSAVA